MKLLAPMPNRKLACLAAGEDATDEAAGSHAKAKEEDVAEKDAVSLACLAAETDAAEEAAGFNVKAKD